MTLNDFEDPTELSRCALSDCHRYRLNKDTPLCAQHVREQEVKSAGFVEPDLEARLAQIRTEDDDHPGQKKVWLDETHFEWVDDPDWKPQPPRAVEPVVEPVRLYVGPDPDTVEPDRPEQPFSSRPAAVEEPGTWIRSKTEPQLTIDGCWVAHHSDWSALTLFNDELEALRYAVANGMQVQRVSWGEELGPQASQRAIQGVEGSRSGGPGGGPGTPGGPGRTPSR